MTYANDAGDSHEVVIDDADEQGALSIAAGWGQGAPDRVTLTTGLAHYDLTPAKAVALAEALLRAAAACGGGNLPAGS